MLIGNSADKGGGAALSDLKNCTVVENSDQDTAGGTYSCSLFNCIVDFNNSNSGSPNYDSYSGFSFCCTTPLPAGQGNISNDPLLVNLAEGDCHLQSNSPCINAGNNAYDSGSTDLDGNPRIVGGTVDIGAYEYQTPASMASYAWLEQYGLPITPNTDPSHPNGTAFDVYQDWIAGLNPTNSASILVMLSPTATNNASGFTVSWESVSGILYNLQRATSLPTPSSFLTIRSNIVGQAGATSYTDASATSNNMYFYRVGVGAP